MSDVMIRQGAISHGDKVKELKEQIAILRSQFADLKQKVSSSPVLIRLLGKSLGFGAASKIDWVYFKLRIKQEELTQTEQVATEDERQKLTGQLSDNVSETARQKMERMIIENPAGLELHIRLAYQPLIESEEGSGRCGSVTDG